MQRFVKAQTWLATMMAVSSLMVVTAGPVSAAGDLTMQDVKECFSYANGTYYANRTVLLYRYNSTGWAQVRSGTTNSSGCIRFNDLARGYYFELVAYTKVGTTCTYLDPWTNVWVGGITSFSGSNGFFGPTGRDDSLWDLGRATVYGTKVC